MSARAFSLLIVVFLVFFIQQSNRTPELITERDDSKDALTKDVLSSGTTASTTLPR